MDNKCKDGTEERQGKSGDVPRISDACFIPAFRVSKWHERELCHLLGISNNTFLFRLQRKVMLFMHKILFFYISFFSSKWWFHKIWDILIQIHYETIQFQRPFFLFLYTRTFEDEPSFVVIWVQTIVCLKCMISHLCLSTIQRDPLLHQPSTCDTWTPALATLPTPLCKWQQPERRPWHYTQSGSQRSSWSSGSLPRALTTQSAVLRSAAQQLCRGITDNNFSICALNTALMTIRKTVWQILMK